MDEAGSLRSLEIPAVSIKKTQEFTTGVAPAALRSFPTVAPAGAEFGHTEHGFGSPPTPAPAAAGGPGPGSAGAGPIPGLPPPPR